MTTDWMDRGSVIAWTLIVAYVLALFAVAGYFTYRAVASPTPDPPGYVCSDSGVVPFRDGRIHGAISAAECHPAR